MTYIMIALGWILDLFYRFIGNYGFAIILFTVFILATVYSFSQNVKMQKNQ